MPSSDDPSPIPPSGSRNAVTAAFLGWTLDAFDFFLVVMTLTAIGAEFHKTVREMALSLTLTLAFRPVGALVFGALADRYGRRRPLMFDLLLYSGAELATGMSHSFQTFLITRAIFGIGMGGEWGVGASLAMENVPARLRGVISGILQEGYPAGCLLATLVYFLIFPHYGWRPLFYIGSLPALLALFIRYKVPESAVWERTKSANWLDLARSIMGNWKIFLYLVALLTMMNMSSHGTQDLYPTFLEKSWQMTPHQRAAMTAVAMFGAVIGGILFGYLSDRRGRRRAMIVAFLCAIPIVPLWAMAPRVSLLIVGAFALQFMIQGAWGIIPAHMCELSPDAVRGFMPGFAYQCGNLIASYVSPLQASLAERVGYARALAESAVFMFIVAVFVIWFGPEKHGQEFGVTSDRAETPAGVPETV
jgi:SHS family lactate transporter-like MFS transporter